MITAAGSPISSSKLDNGVEKKTIFKLSYIPLTTEFKGLYIALLLIPASFAQPSCELA